MSTTPPGCIAIVDDDSAVLESFKFMLEIAGFQVVTYASAIAFLQSDLPNPRCLILDHHMPKMTGLELAARLRAAGDGTPIMLITSALSPMIVAHAAELGIEHVLEKPPTEEDLLRFISARC